MLAKRIIPCLDIKNGRTVKGINFLSLADAGDPVENAVRYSQSGADELVFLDITATVENRETLSSLVEKIAENGWNLDIKNPFVKEEEVTHTTAELLDKLSVSFKKSDELIAELRNGLAGK